MSSLHKVIYEALLYIWGEISLKGDGGHAESVHVVVKE